MKEIYIYFLCLSTFFSCTQDPSGGIITLPVSPTNLSALLISGSQVDLSWTDNSTNETGFKIDRKITSGQWQTIAAVGANVVSYSDLGLTINTTYTYRVFAYSSAGNSPTYSNEVTITTRSVPIISTIALSNLTTTGVKSGGNISNDGGSTVTSRGVCWSTSSNPNASMSTKTIDGNGIGIYQSDITGLSPNTTYFVRAYAINNVGVGYGNELTFTTLAPSLPTLNTTPVSNSTCTTAMAGGSISNDGGAQVTARGLCWSTSPNPTITANLVSNGSGSGSFIGIMSGLVPNTVYYVRAYATNSGGTAYGNELTFSTLPYSLATVVTAGLTSVTSTTFISGGSISFNGCSNISEKGLCWSTSPNPTTSLSTKMANGSGTTSFISPISGLSPNTTYYVRAYATNNSGTAYGNQIIFTTPNIETVTICNKIWAQRNLDVERYRNGDIIPQVTDPNAWKNLTTGAWCYKSNDTANGVVYGKIYNWYAVNDPRGLAPSGWHVASLSDWRKLLKCLDQNSDTTDGGGGLSNFAGGYIKSTGTNYWTSPNIGATNSSNFTALPGGARSNVNGAFDDTGNNAIWWTSTPYSPSITAYYFITYNSNTQLLGSFSGDKAFGISVRLVKD